MIISDQLGEVTGLRITVLMDDYAGYNSEYLASHGISLLLDITAANTKKRILLDVGPNPLPLRHNMQKAGIDPSTIDMIFFSHCHYDHTLAAADLLETIGKDVLIVAHPGIFRKNYHIGPYLQEIGITARNSYERLTSLGGQIVLVKHPFPLMEGVFSSGEIERTTSFEGSSIGTYNLVDGELKPDGLLDDLSIVINLKDRGLFIVAGCSHAGIINIIKHAVKITGITRVYGVAGGLHLVSADDGIIDDTINHLEQYNPGLLATGHCTGIKAQYRIAERFGDRYTMLHSGKVIDVL